MTAVVNNDFHEDLRELLDATQAAQEALQDTYYYTAGVIEDPPRVNEIEARLHRARRRIRAYMMPESPTVTVQDLVRAEGSTWGDCLA